MGFRGKNGGDSLHSRVPSLLWIALALSVGVGIFTRNFWTPDEPREADLAWRMSWQANAAVPLLAGEAFCEKPPFAYWLAGASIRFLGQSAWAARIPNALYALLTALAMRALGRRCIGPVAGLASAAAISTMVLPYQVTIWLATDAPLLAAVTVALLGMYEGFYAVDRRVRLRGYTGMHAALAIGFLSKSAAAWLTPALAFMTIVAWERRWRELLRWELYLGLLVQIGLILTWMGFVLAGPDGAAHLKVFFWNNLVGRFVHVDAPDALQYASAHRNTPGKYFLELPVYLWPWTLLCVAAARRAWQQRESLTEQHRAVRFAVAVFVPTLAVLSLAATARNIYLAPALPGAALLLGWWVGELLDKEHVASRAPDRWDRRALQITALLLSFSALILAGVITALGVDSWGLVPAAAQVKEAGISAVGIAAAAVAAVASWRAAGRGSMARALVTLLLAYGAILVGPASQIYAHVNSWQDLATIGQKIRRDTAGHEIILFVPDETTRAFIDMYARTDVQRVSAPLTARSTGELQQALIVHPQSVVVAQLAGRNDGGAMRTLLGKLNDAWAPPPTVRIDLPGWAADSGLILMHRYAEPHGRRYGLFEADNAAR